MDCRFLYLFEMAAWSMWRISLVIWRDFRDLKQMYNVPRLGMRDESRGGLRAEVITPHFIFTLGKCASP